MIVDAPKSVSATLADNNCILFIVSVGRAPSVNNKTGFVNFFYKTKQFFICLKLEEIRKNSPSSLRLLMSESPLLLIDSLVLLEPLLPELPELELVEVEDEPVPALIAVECNACEVGRRPSRPN